MNKTTVIVIIFLAMIIGGCLESHGCDNDGLIVCVEGDNISAQDFNISKDDNITFLWVTIEFSSAIPLDSHLVNNSHRIQMEFSNQNDTFHLDEGSQLMMESTHLEENTEYSFTIGVELISGKYSIRETDIYSHFTIDENQDLEIVIDDIEYYPFLELEEDGMIIRMSNIALIFNLGVNCD